MVYVDWISWLARIKKLLLRQLLDLGIQGWEWMVLIFASHDKKLLIFFQLSNLFRFYLQLTHFFRWQWQWVHVSVHCRARRLLSPSHTFQVTMTMISGLVILSSICWQIISVRQCHFFFFLSFLNVDLSLCLLHGYLMVLWLYWEVDGFVIVLRSKSEVVVSHFDIHVLHCLYAFIYSKFP
jgi:hypothetical protein